MRYKEFRFKNFKGIENMSLPLSEGVTTLIGLNESGKTTILEAIFCFSYGAEDLDIINPTLASLRNSDQWIPISQRANFNGKIEIAAVVVLDAEDKSQLKKHMRSSCGLILSYIPSEIKISEEYHFENSRFSQKKRFWVVRVEGTKGQQRNPRSYSGGDNEWRECVSFITGRLPRIWYFPDFLFELPERFELTDPVASDEQLDKSQFYRTTFEDVLRQLGYGATIQTHIVDRLHSTERADQRSLDALLLDMGRSITKTIFEGWNRIFGRDPAAQEVQIGASPESDAGAFLELKIKGPDGYYDLSERSLGFRWFFMFLLMTSFHGSVDSHSKPLFLLDEPASNLHSSAQAELLKSFENLLDRCDLIYTTHSHHLINVRWLDAAYVVKNAALSSLDFADYLTTRMGARTSISATKYRQFAVQHPDQTSYFEPVLELLDYRPSVLEPVPDVVLVEGKSDFFILRYMTDVVGINSELKFVPGTGAGSLDTVIRLHIGWGKSFLILLDGDAEGKKQRERYRQEFGPMVTDRCVLISEMCHDLKVKETEGILSATDKAAIISAVFAKSVQAPNPKKALQHAVMELYARKQAVPLETDTKERFELLMAELKQHLR